MKKITTILLILVFTSVFSQVPAYVPINGLIGYWPFNGNANDESGNGHNGLLQSGSNGTINFVSDKFGNVNSAIKFSSNPTWNSLGPYIEIPNSQNLLVNSDFTVTYTIKGSEQNSVGEIINKGGDNSPSLFIARIAYGNLENFITGSGNCNISGFPIGSWQTISITYSNSLLSLYLNGIFQQSTFSSSMQSSLSQYYFGAQLSGGSNGSFYPFQGIMDDISFYSRVLTPQEITGLYTATLNTSAVTQNNDVSIYPNPANDHITIDFGNLGNVSGYQIKVVNMLGQEVFNGAMKAQKYILPTNSWSGTGVYFVKIYDASNNLLHTKKITLQ